MNLRDWLVDYAYLIRGGLAFRRRPPRHFRNFTSENKVPVILLSGLMLKWPAMLKLGNSISRAGHPVYVMPDLGRNFINVPRSAELVRHLIDDHNLSRVVIVGHSKGGIIGKQLLAHHNSDGRIQALIAMASPFHGARLARRVPHEAFREMLSTSASINELHKHDDVNKYIYSIFPKYDNHIVPDDGTSLAGATNIIIPIRGHHRVIFDKKSARAVMDILNNLSTSQK